MSPPSPRAWPALALALGVLAALAPASSALPPGISSPFLSFVLLESHAGSWPTVAATPGLACSTSGTATPTEAHVRVECSPALGDGWTCRDAHVVVDAEGSGLATGASWCVGMAAECTSVDGADCFDYAIGRGLFPFVCKADVVGTFLRWTVLCRA